MSMYVAFTLQWRVRKPSPKNIPSLQNYFQTNCQSVILMLLKSTGKTIELGQFVWV